ncbi:MAG TPA: hypothetical protein VFB25_12700 [Gaiellaceae bacterium]|nr:hypothetical protein [Gaiellaceae bacterium]
MKKLVLVVAAALAIVPSALAASPKPVPSLTPAATHKLWLAEVARAKSAPRAFDDASCRPARAIFYAQTDWLRLATTLAAQPSPCAQYFVSVPPLAADKTQARPNQAAQIRALGPSFHALDEISWNGWSSWVAAGNGSFYDAGVLARQRMAAAGFDVSAGDTWALNELSSAVRSNTGAARANALEFMRGLASDGVKGVVFVAGVAQTTSDTGTYQDNLQSWLTDDGFWSAAAQYASDWAQEDYGDVRAYAVANTTPQQRRDVEEQYLGHVLALANANPDAEAASRSFIDSTYVAFGNAAWAWSSAYGYTAVPVATMEDFVSGQIYADRSLGAPSGVDRFGFAWAPQNSLGLSTADYNAQTAAVLARIAASIRDSGTNVDAACSTFCTTSVAGAAFTSAWASFGTWATTALSLGQPSSFTAGTSVPLTVTLQQLGVPENASGPIEVTLSSSSTGGGFAAVAGGAVTPTLSATIPAGASSVTVYYTDTVAGSPTVSAAAPGYATVTQVENVAAAAPATLTATPASSSTTAGTPVTIALGAHDAYGNPATLPSPVTETTSSTHGAFTSSGTSVSYTDTLAGTPTLTFTAPGVPAVTLTETVVPAAAAKLTLSPASASVKTGKAASFTATATDAYGNRTTVTPAWSLSSTAYGKVTASGPTAKFTAGTKTGSVTLTAAAGSARTSAKITITR